MLPRRLQASSEPTGRGEEPQVLATVANQQGSPASSQAATWFSTSLSTACMDTMRP